MIGSFAGSLLTEEGTLYLENLYVADTWWTRFRGLQFQQKLPAKTGLLLNPCSSVHTCFMKFPLNLIFLDQQGSVVECREDVRPWRFVLPKCRNIVATLEVPISQPLPAIGTQLLLERPSGRGPLLDRHPDKPLK